MVKFCIWCSSNRHLMAHQMTNLCVFSLFHCVSRYRRHWCSMQRRPKKDQWATPRWTQMEGCKGHMPTKGIGRTYRSHEFQGCFQDVFRVVSGCFQGVFPYALSGYALWTLTKLKMVATCEPFSPSSLQNARNPKFVQNLSQRLFWGVPVRGTEIWKNLSKFVRTVIFGQFLTKSSKYQSPWLEPPKQSLGRILHKFGGLGVFEGCKGEKGSQVAVMIGGPPLSQDVLDREVDCRYLHLPTLASNPNVGDLVALKRCDFYKTLWRLRCVCVLKTLRFRGTKGKRPMRFGKLRAKTQRI